MFEEMAGTPNKFVILREWVLADKRLTNSEKLVYTRMCQFDEYFESCEEASRVIGIAVGTIKRAKRKLVLLGYAEELANTGRGKRYRALYDLRGNKMSPQRGQNVPSEGTNCPLRGDKMSRIVIELKKSNKKNIVSPSAKPKADLPSKAYELAEKLHDLVLKNKPDRKINNNWKENWAGSIEKAHRVDKRSWDKLEEVIEFSQKDSFWRANILSGEKLREKFDQLDYQATQESKNKTNFIKLS